MRSRRYTQEVGIATANERAPLVVTCIVLAVVAVAAIWFVRNMASYQPAQVAEAAPAPAIKKISKR